MTEPGASGAGERACHRAGPLGSQEAVCQVDFPESFGQPIAQLNLGAAVQSRVPPGNCTRLVTPLTVTLSCSSLSICGKSIPTSTSTSHPGCGSTHGSSRGRNRNTVREESRKRNWQLAANTESRVDPEAAAAPPKHQALWASPVGLPAGRSSPANRREPAARPERLAAEDAGAAGGAGVGRIGAAAGPTCWPVDCWATARASTRNGTRQSAKTRRPAASFHRGVRVMAETILNLLLGVGRFRRFSLKLIVAGTGRPSGFLRSRAVIHVLSSVFLASVADRPTGFGPMSRSVKLGRPPRSHRTTRPFPGRVGRTRGLWGQLRLET